MPTFVKLTAAPVAGGGDTWINMDTIECIARDRQTRCTSVYPVGSRAGGWRTVIETPDEIMHLIELAQQRGGG